MLKEAQRCELPFYLRVVFKNIVLSERSAVKKSFSTSIWNEVDSCFCEAVYVYRASFAVVEKI